MLFSAAIQRTSSQKIMKGLRFVYLLPRCCVVSQPCVVTKVGCDILSWQDNASLLLAAETIPVRLETFRQSKLLPLVFQLSSRHHENIHLSLAQDNYLVQIPKKDISCSSAAAFLSDFQGS